MPYKDPEKHNLEARRRYAVDPSIQKKRKIAHKEENREHVLQLGMTQTQRWRAANPDKLPAINRRGRLRSKGLTEESFNKMLAAQNYQCAICSSPDPGGVGNFRIDHDHSCCPGSSSCGDCVRGLLCNGCNSALGHMKDDPERLIRAAAYLGGLIEERPLAV